ncbi:cysteine synthase family protein [Alkalibacterium psychrotolerans]
MCFFSRKIRKGVIGLIIHSVNELIGNTPLMQIHGYDLPKGTRILAKLEQFNPGGSIKDRLGSYLIQQGLKSGDINKDTVIIEPTAGNTGIALALAALEYGMKTWFVVPEKFSQEKQVLMQVLGAEIIHTPTEEGITGAIEKAKELHKATENSYLPLQFENHLNPAVYYETLGPELISDLDDQLPDSFVAGAGSGGTFSGISRYLKEKSPAVRTAIVEPEGSILAGGTPGSHDTEGIGVESIPPFLDKETLDAIYTISDQEAFYYTKELARKNGLFVGSSSGAAFAAALKEAKTLPEGSTIVTIFPDGSERYLSKNIYHYKGDDTK